MKKGKGDMKRAAGVIIFLAASSMIAGCPPPPRLVRFHDPLTPQEHTNLGAIYEREGNMDRASQEYAAALKKEPDNLVALTGMGNIALARGMPRVAARYYAHALEVDEENIVVLNNLAIAWLRAGKPKKALGFADRSVELDQEADPRVLETRAQVRLALGDRAGAVSDLETASSLCQSACRPSMPRNGINEENLPNRTEKCGPTMAGACKEIEIGMEEIATED